MKALLTCAGFDNDSLVPVFHDLLGRKVDDVKALFIPTALNTPDAREYIHVFKEDLYKIGVADENIDSYDLEEPFDEEKIRDYGIVFICPGDPGHLLRRVNEVKFANALEVFFNNGGVYIGVSAGSDIVALNLPDNLGYLNATIQCHSKEGHPAGILDTESAPFVKLTDNQAIVINKNKVEIIG